MSQFAPDAQVGSLHTVRTSGAGKTTLRLRLPNEFSGALLLLGTVAAAFVGVRGGIKIDGTNVTQLTGYSLGMGVCCTDSADSLASNTEEDTDLSVGELLPRHECQENPVLGIFAARREGFLQALCLLLPEDSECPPPQSFFFLRPLRRRFLPVGERGRLLCARFTQLPVQYGRLQCSCSSLGVVR